MLRDFKEKPPKFIVDSRKRHIPLERPPYELWPIAPKGFLGLKETTFLPLNEKFITAYDKAWAQNLRKRFDKDEARRYELLAPLREFIRENYRIVQMFGQHVLFELKETSQG